jgi:hypothetical protein
MSNHGSRSGSPIQVPTVDFLDKDVTDEDVKSVNGSQKTVAKFILRNFRQELRSVFYFLRGELRTTQEGITAGMKNTMSDVRVWTESAEEKSRTLTDALEERLVQIERPELRRGEGLKPARPDTFSGDRSVRKEWIRTVRHYMDLRPQDFRSDAVRIGWTLSFFKEGRANSFAQEAHDYKERHGDKWKWPTWDEFLTVYRVEFYEQEAETVAFLKLEASDYFQGKRTVSDYCDAFQKLIQEAGLTDPRTIVSKFRRGLRRDVDEDISPKIGLILDDPERWYSKAKESELVTKFTKAYHEIGTAPTRSFIPYRSMATQDRSTPDVRSASESKPPAASTPAPAKTPAKPQADRTKFKSRLNCWNCGKEGHPSWLCPDQESERKEKICVTELPDEELHRLAEIAMELVDKEHAEELAEQGFREANFKGCTSLA